MASNNSPVQAGEGTVSLDLPDRHAPENESSGPDSLAFDPEYMTADKIDIRECIEHGSDSESTRSATSSVFNFVEEHGRTYHSYKDGKYALPNDERERERLDFQREVIKTVAHGHIFQAPLNNPKKALDLGTGTGRWAIEFADLFPDCDVTGVDLSPIQPNDVPPNCHFEIDDVEDEFLYSQKFDFIRAGVLGAYIRDIPALFKKIFDNLNPGGWIEIEDIDWEYKSPDNTLQDTAFHRFNQLMLEGVQKRGCDPRFILHLKRWMEEMGFQNVRQKDYAIAIGNWHNDPRQKQLGVLAQENALKALHALSSRLFEHTGWSDEEKELFLIDVRKDLAGNRIHSYTTISIVYGQKPI